VAEAGELLASDAPTDSSIAGANAVLGRVEVLIKLWQADAALKLFDSLRAHPFTMRGGTNPITVGNVLASVGPTFGRMTLFDSLVTIGSRGAPPSRQAFSRAALRMMANVPSDSFPTLLTAIFGEAVAGGAGTLATRQLAPLLALAVRSFPPAQWPTLDSTVTDPRAAPAIAIQRGDTVALRRSARVLDSLSTVLAGAAMADSGITLWAAEAYLALRDSVAALNMTQRWLDTIVAFTPLLVNQTGGSPQVQLPRAILLRADLAAGLGRRDEARVWYGRLLAFWAHADADTRPVVERVRRAYAAMGGA
jgi:hypothetical protein